MESFQNGPKELSWRHVGLVIMGEVCFEIGVSVQHLLVNVPHGEIRVKHQLLLTHLLVSQVLGLRELTCLPPLMTSFINVRLLSFKEGRYMSTALREAYSGPEGSNTYPPSWRFCRRAPATILAPCLAPLSPPLIIMEPPATSSLFSNFANMDPDNATSPLIAPTDIPGHILEECNLKFGLHHVSALLSSHDATESALAPGTSPEAPKAE